MSKAKIINAALAVTVAIPAFAEAAVAFTQQNVSQAKGNIVVAQTTIKANPDAEVSRADSRKAKSELRSALKRMPAAEKTKMGASRYNRLTSLSGEELVRAGCFTHGVGCGGTPQWSHGVLCCAIIKMTI